MNIFEFTKQYPELAFDFEVQIKDQPGRLYDPEQLSGLPGELTPVAPYHRPGRGRPSVNQTRTHSQCVECKKVLRNDHFYAPPSFRRDGRIFPQCLECVQASNAAKSSQDPAPLADRRDAIWQMISQACAICGFDAHVSAMDMHHIGGKDAAIAKLITEIAQSSPAKVHRVEKLLSELNKCLPLCSNCHRMVHAGHLQIPASAKPTRFTLAEMMSLINAGVAPS